IGARRRDIKRMFLIETLTLSLLGGVFGTLLGVGSSAIFAQVLEWGFIVDSYAIPLGIGVSTIVGIFFGLYPAVIAARMQPVEALRGD
ncbi:MAG: ABC transporter permease, partial [bacterium]